MKTRSQIFLGRAATVAAVLGISMLGNLRSQASETAGSAPSGPLVVAKSTPVDTLRVADANALHAFGSDEDDVAGGEDSASADVDDGHLVPAIYAWDPDVRFVYYRHVSKWM